MSIEAMKLVLEALEADEQDMVADKDGHMVFRVDVAITALRQAIEQAQKQEPVALKPCWYESKEMKMCRKCGQVHAEAIIDIAPPPRQPWVGLTDEEIEDLYFDKFSMGELKAFAQAIEAKLKEKNT